ncbi:MAG: tetrahydrodipicolinate N-acetyltransferase [Actinomycetota bacterium]|jgi:acetyltransferase-like isoleucine patch superfamily enzyme
MVQDLLPVRRAVRSLTSGGPASARLNGASSVAPSAVLEGRVVIGDGAVIGDSAVLVAAGEAAGPAEVVIGEGARIGRFTTITSQTRVTIEAGAVVGDLTVITDHWGPASRPGFVGPPAARPVVVGAGARVEHGAVICAGVTIGAGAVVAAGAVVVDDVPPNAAVRGNPARMGTALT